MPDQPADGRLLIAVGSSTSKAVSTGISAYSRSAILAGTVPIDLVWLAGGKDHLVRTAALVLTAELRRREPESAVRERNGVTSAAPPSCPWLDVAAPPGAERFAIVRVPGWWPEAERLCLVSRLPGRSASPSSRPMTILASLAHRRQRWAARLSPDRLALAAELASPWRPRLVVLVGTFLSRRVAIFSHDLIAAELAWLAAAESIAGAQMIGPWEDPAIQRATAMDLGVVGPSQLLISAAPANEGDPLVHRFAVALGVDLRGPA